MNTGFPTLTNSFLNGQDLLYTQFNDVDFYVEDIEQENLYYLTLRKIFPTIKLAKIFPLNGKPNVINAAKSTVLKKRKVYLLDNDFDDLLGKQEIIPNLFYLEKYSIENYLLEEEAIQEIIIEEKPKTTITEISKLFNLADFTKESHKLFRELVAAHIVVQSHALGIENVKTSPSKYCDFNPSSAVKTSILQNYKNEINSLLKKKDRRFSVQCQINKWRRILKDTTHIPGKYLLKFLQSRIGHLFHVQFNFESFVFRLAKNCQLTSLDHLKAPILAFIT